MNRTAERRAQLEALLTASPIVPVVTIDRVEDAVPLARALLAGGITAIEVTLRTPAARAAAAALIREVAEIAVGIGTVLDPAQLNDAEQLGARFAVSPGTTPELLAAAGSSTLPYLPGVATASDVMQCLAHGFDIQKFFPAVPAGGLAALRALAGPFPQVRFCPTGGIGAANAKDWLAETNVLAVGGSWIAPNEAIRAADWAAISARARQSLEAAGRRHG